MPTAPNVNDLLSLDDATGPAVPAKAPKRSLARDATLATGAKPSTPSDEKIVAAANKLAQGISPTAADFDRGGTLPSTMMWAGDSSMKPWSAKYGTFVGEDLVDSATALKMASLDWGVEKAPAFQMGPDCYRTHDGTPILDADGTPIPRPLELPDDFVIRRQDNYTRLGMVGGRYKPFQNADAFALLDALVQDGELRYHTAGSLRGGSVIWVLAQLKGNLEPVPGDVINKFLCFTNSHDGSRAIRLFWTTIRVCCLNTLQHACSLAKREGVTIKHTTNLVQRLSQAQTLLGLAQKGFDEIQELYTQLANTQLDAQGFEAFTKVVLPHASDRDPEAKVSTRTANMRQKLSDLFEGEAQGFEILQAAGKQYTLHGAMESLTEYTNHHRSGWSTKDESERLNSLWWGGSHQTHTAARKFSLDYLANQEAAVSLANQGRWSLTAIDSTGAVNAKALQYVTQASA